VLTDIISDTRRASETIDQMRNLLRKRENPRQPVEVNRLVEESLRILRSEAVIQGIQLSTDLAPGLPAVPGERTQLQQVLLNVVANAQQAMASAGSSPRQLLIRTTGSEPGRIRITVDDSGPGFEAGTEDQVFQPFFTTRPEGIGMGLAICLSIVEAHGGRISAGNRPEGGGRIRIELPATERSEFEVPTSGGTT
jgi:C4-dicarboxylate-specific signal transduction histidine kinase